jgi:hypothetical protein
MSLTPQEKNRWQELKEKRPKDLETLIEYTNLKKKSSRLPEPWLYKEEVEMLLDKGVEPVKLDLETGAADAPLIVVYFEYANHDLLFKHGVSFDPETVWKHVKRDLFAE